MLHIIDCCSSSSINKEKAVPITSESLRLRNLLSIIACHFETSQRVRLFNILGIEILDDSDLQHYYDPHTGMDEHKLIFFTKEHEPFENHNLMRVFKIKKLLGEVLILTK